MYSKKQIRTIPLIGIWGGGGWGADRNLIKSLLRREWAIIRDALVKGDENIQNLENIIKMQEVYP